MAIPIAALLLLVLLASLQYYWVGQVSVGELERMRASLRAGATRFSEDFDRELARIYLSLQMDAATMRDQSWKDYARRYDHWFATAPYPRLVGDVYLVQIYENGRLYLAQYDTEVKRFRTVDWPESLTSLRQRFEDAAETTHVEGSMVVGSTPPPVAEDLPALIIPLSRMSLLSDRQQFTIDADFFAGDTVFAWPKRPCAYCAPQVNAGPLFGYTIVLLDRAYLQQEFIPALARHYFASDSGLDYNLAIVSRHDPQQIFYQTDPRPARVMPAVADAVAGLLSVRPDEFNSLLLDNSLILGEGTQGEDRRSWRIAISTVISAAHPPEPGAEALLGDADGRWQLVLTHRAGSLDAAIAYLRLRNLLLSSGILLLLASSLAMMVITTRRAQRLAQQKMDFVAAISHELRTPLAVIRSAGENLADGVVLDPQRARQYGVVIHNEGRRLTEMVEQALEFAGVRTDHQPYDLRPVEIRDLIERALLDCQAKIHEGGFQVEQDIAPDLPPVMADPQTLRRAFQNLISNAIKYGGEQRWIKVSARALPSRRGPEIRISVEDRGIGIAPADLPHIFEPFYRGRSIITTDIYGTGLGLNLVKQIVEAHGGRVSVESTVGQGSTFTLHLYGQPNEEIIGGIIGRFGNT
ncbi:MAG: sensor histidine kinase [Roseiflexaceae bacterium]